MSIDLASIRTGIATLLRSVDGIKTVDAYDRADASTSNLPAASILLVRVTQPGYGDTGFGQLGGYDYEAEWHINVRLNMPQGPRPEVRAQQLFEQIFAAVRAQFDPNQMIDPNGPGIVDVSSITVGELMIPSDSKLPFVAAFVLKTRVVS